MSLAGIAASTAYQDAKGSWPYRIGSVCKDQTNRKQSLHPWVVIAHAGAEEPKSFMTLEGPEKQSRQPSILHRTVQMASFRKLLRFKNAAGQILYGEADHVSEVTHDGLIGTSVPVYNGVDPWAANFGLTGSVDTVAEVSRVPKISN